MDKVGQRQRLCNCVNSQILRATHRQGEGEEGRFVNFFDRSKPYLCCWSNLNWAPGLID